jgi:hypothetical protein
VARDYVPRSALAIASGDCDRRSRTVRNARSWTPVVWGQFRPFIEDVDEVLPDRMIGSGIRAMSDEFPAKMEFF